MVEFETIEKERRDYGNFPGEKFIELSRNKSNPKKMAAKNSFIQIANRLLSGRGTKIQELIETQMIDQA
ncbi:hypothetical protein HRED_07092 [Candidatus Haloredivivus sp. G17]|nr:hypothetical protein HRED_07092 [Candidatus Haloredivivus sp. G17]